MAGILSKFVTCSCYEAGHTWVDSCFFGAMDVAMSCFKYALTLYGPLHTVSALLNKRGKEYFKKRLLQDILQSSFFLACNGGGAVMCFCFLRKLVGRFTILTAGFLPGLISSLFAINVERKSRRSALGIYMLNQALETCFNIMKSGGYARDVPFGEVLIFCGSLSVVMYLYRSRSLPNGFVKEMIQKGLGEKELRTTHLERNELFSYAQFDIAHMKKSARLAGQAFLAGYGVQTSLNLLMALSSTFKNPLKPFKSFLLKSNFQAGAFLGSLVAIYRASEMMLLKLKKIDPAINSAIAGGLAGLSLLFQRSSYIALYLASKTIELVYMSGIEKGILPYMKQFDSILYGLSTAVMFHAAIIQPLYLRPTYFNFLVKLTGKRFASIDRSRWEPFGLDSTKIDRMVEAGGSIYNKHM